ncbi:MAG: hypothetical protein IPH13_11385 [Planctomycetes bacterium]|nr:hypothetical protein [Planctomycetota bacterium]MCC7172940.1 hypothetical protein [Planctomycetota bacterium]
MTAQRTSRVGVALAIAAVVTLCAWYFGFRSTAVDLGAAQWFVVGPSGRVIGVGRPDGSLGLIDLDGQALGVLSVGAATDSLVLGRDDTAFVVEGGTEGTQRYVARMARSASAITTSRVDVPAGSRLVPVVDGAKARGGLERDATRMLLAVRGAADGGERVEGLRWLDLATLATTPVPLAFDGEIARAVTAMPGQGGFALLCVPSSGATSSTPARLRVFDAAGAPLYVVEDVAPVLPYWLPETGTLLFERAAGGISRFHPPDGKPVWVCDGRFTDAVARGYVAARDLQEAWVLVEKADGDGYVQVAQIWPFESGARRTRNLTTGLVHKFGLAVSFDHRFVAFRQVDGKLEGGAVDERVVLVDQSASYRSSTVIDRKVEPKATDIGPEFPASEDVVLYIDDNRLHKLIVD